MEINNIISEQTSLDDPSKINENRIDEIEGLLSQVLTSLEINLSSNANFKKLDKSLLMRQITEKIERGERDITKEIELPQERPYFIIKEQIEQILNDNSNGIDTVAMEDYKKQVLTVNSYVTLVIREAINADNEITNDSVILVAIRQELTELLTKMEQNSSMKEEYRNQITALQPLVETISNTNIAPKTGSILSMESMMTFFGISEDDNFLEQEFESEAYVEKLLTQGASNPSNPTDYGYLIFIYLKYIYNNSNDFPQDAKKILKLVSKKKDSLDFTEAEIDLLIPKGNNSNLARYNEIKTLLTSKFQDRSFIDQLIAVLYSKEKGPNIETWYLKPNMKPETITVDDNTKQINSPYDLIILPDDSTFPVKMIQERGLFTKAVTREDIMNKFINFLHTTYGHALIPTDDGKLILTKTLPARDTTSIYTSSETNKQLLDIFKEKEGGDFVRIERTTEPYVNHLFGNPVVTSEGYIISSHNAKPNASNEVGIPPILIDTRCTTLTYYEHDAVLNVDVDLDPYFAKLIENNYSKFEIQHPYNPGEKHCIWLLKLDISYLTDTFENFNAQDYASIIYAAHADIGKLAYLPNLAALIKKHEKLSASNILGVNTEEAIIRNYISNSGIQIDYFSDLTIKGIQDREKNTVRNNIEIKV
jgi:hypothetical protein